MGRPGEGGEDWPDGAAALVTRACDCLADLTDARLAGIVRLAGTLVAGSSACLSLPAADRAAIAAAVAGAVEAAGSDGTRAQSADGLPWQEGRADLAGWAMPLPDHHRIAFAVPDRAATFDRQRFCRAALSVLPLVTGLERLAAPRDARAGAAPTVAAIEALADIGVFQLDGASGALTWSAAAALVAGNGVPPADCDALLALLASPARETLRRDIVRVLSEGGTLERLLAIQPEGGARRIVRLRGQCDPHSEPRTLVGIVADAGLADRHWPSALTDPLTGLPNAMLFADRLAQAVARADAVGGPFALLVLALAEPGGGRDAGTLEADVLAMRHRLTGVLRPVDTLARLAPDRFAILVDGVGDRVKLAGVLSRLGHALASVRADAGPGATGRAPRCGVALYGAPATTPEALMRAADAALAQARSALDRSVVVYDGAPLAGAAAEGMLDRARAALAAGRFEAHYQPQFDLETDALVGVEALARWRDGDDLRPAHECADVFADPEMGAAISRAVLDQVIADTARLMRCAGRPFRVSVNVSRADIEGTDYLDTFAARAADGALSPADFILEVTEDVILAAEDRALADKLALLADQGVQLALDDFGTGFASLVHLARFPIGELKIDRAFVHGIATDRKKRLIVKGVIDMAAALGLTVVAEGVETVEEREVLRDLGCRYVQGFLYAGPLPFPALAVALAR